MSTSASPSLELVAHAKLNLTLEVLRARPDGYHELRSVFQEIELADTLAFYPDDELVLQCSARGLESDSNLVLRAAHVLRKATGCRKGARIVLEKRIPIAAGLGGGSSDAATALRGLNQLWRLRLDTDRLAALAPQIGSDVPFFLLGGTALASGRGEKLERLPPLPETWMVLLFPPYSEVTGKTGRLYSLLSPEHYTDGAATLRLAGALSSGRFDASLLCNVFEAVASRVFPGIEAHVHALREAGARFVHLSGSGPTLYGLVAGREEGEVVVGRLASSGRRAVLTRTVA